MNLKDDLKKNEQNMLAQSYKKNEQNRLENQIRSYKNTQSTPSITNNINQNNQSNKKINQKNKKSNLFNKAVNKAASAGLQTMGVPKGVSDKVVNSEVGQKVLDKMKTKNPTLNMLDRLFNSRKKVEEDYNVTTTENFKISIKVIKWLAIFSVPVFVIIIFCALILPSTQVYINSIGLGNADNVTLPDAEDKINNSNEKDWDKEIKDKNSVSVSFNYTEYAKRYAVNSSISRDKNEADLEELEDFYGSSFVDENIESSDKKTYAQKFYLKLRDLYLRYNIKCNGVQLDLPLIMATLNQQSTDMNEVFMANTVEKYDRTKLDDGSVSTVLDYDYDWSNYKISHNNSSHDMEILAQHMISKDENGICKIDTNKYDEFLKEFLEKKYFLDNSKEYSISDYNLNGPIQNPNNQVDIDNGDWRNWLQCDKKWGSYKLSPSKDAMCKIGCLVTSISIQIARSGTVISTDNIDPGIASKKFKFTSSGSLYWDSVTRLSPNFSKKAKISLTGMNKNSVAKKLASYSNNYYIVLNVSKKSLNKAHHYVALDYVDINTGDIFIIDPAPMKNNPTNLYANYKLYNAVVFEKKD